MPQLNQKMMKKSLKSKQKTLIRLWKKSCKYKFNVSQEFKYLKTNLGDTNNSILKDISKLTLKFQELEENILKLMDKKQNIDKEFEKLLKNNKNEGDVKTYY